MEELMEVENKQVILKGYIDRAPLESDMELKVGNQIKLKISKGCNSVLVKNLYLSCDPYMRARMRDFQGSYIPPFVPGKPIEGFGVSKVIDSDDPNFQAGDIVSGFTGWEEYSLIEDTKKLRKIQQHDIPLSYHIGLLEQVGAYYREGKIVYIEDMNEGLESAPSALVGLFTGKNVGKQVVCVSRD
ncbi:hypothetical protein SOVF_129270 [Spinacia oleracea]|nr:hypothetical protein SOVF_129270 [Spinacia oleracea]